MDSTTKKTTSSVMRQTCKTADKQPALRKLLAAAAVTACGVTCTAQAQSSVQIYGKLYPQLTSYHLSGGTSPGTSVSTLVAPVTAGAADASGTLMESSNSRLGFRGSEKLGANLKAIFQMETSFSVDSGALSSADILFSRNTFIGLNGDFGTVRMGRMDSVYKDLGDNLGFMGLQSGNFVSASNILSQRGFGTGNADRFHERPSNTIDYETPDFNGFKGVIGYSLGEVAGKGKRGNIASGGVAYAAGPVYLALAHEQHYDLYGGSRNAPAGLRNISAAGGTGATYDPLPGTSSKDMSTRLTAHYKFTNATRAEVNFAVTRLAETGGAAGRFEEYQQNNWNVGVEHKIGAWTMVGTYGAAMEGSCSRVGGAACSTDGLEGSMLSLGTSYNFSKRTSLFALFSKMTNGKSARYGQSSDAPSPGVGQDMRQAALGISHNF